MLIIVWLLLKSFPWFSAGWDEHLQLGAVKNWGHSFARMVQYLEMLAFFSDKKSWRCETTMTCFYRSNFWTCVFWGYWRRQRHCNFGSFLWNHLRFSWRCEMIWCYVKSSNAAWVCWTFFVFLLLGWSVGFFSLPSHTSAKKNCGKKKLVWSWWWL